MAGTIFPATSFVLCASAVGMPGGSSLLRAVSLFRVCGVVDVGGQRVSLGCAEDVNGGLCRGGRGNVPSEVV